MTRSTAVLVDARITQLCDHRGLGRHFLAIAPKADIGLPPVEADGDAADWGAAHGSVRSRAPGVARVDAGPAGAGSYPVPAARQGQRFCAGP